MPSSRYELDFFLNTVVIKTQKNPDAYSSLRRLNIDLDSLSH